MATYHTFGGTTYNLGTSIGSTDTTILLSSFKVPVTGDDITMVLLNTDIVYATIAPKTTSSEFISFTGITQNSNGSATLTGVTRGLNKTYPFTTSASFKLPHSGQTQFIISDAPQVFEKYVSIDNTQTIDGVKTFSSNVTVPVLPIANTDAASKGYADGLAIAGAPNASTTVKGIVELATQAEVLAKTATGGTGASLVATPDLQASTLLSDYKADTGAVNAAVITPAPALTAYVTGQRFSVKMVATNTTTNPTINVNGLGAKTIVKLGGAVLSAGDLLINGIYEFEYDGTNMQLMTPASTSIAKSLKSATTVVDVSAATAPSSGQALVATSTTTATWQTIGLFKNGTATRAGDTATGSQTIAHGLGVIPKYIRITARKMVNAGAPSIFATSDGVYNGTTASNVYLLVVSDGTLIPTSNVTANMVTIYDDGQTPKSQIATVAFDATNITLSWTRTGSTNSIQISMLWEAFA